MSTLKSRLKRRRRRTTSEVPVPLPEEEEVVPAVMIPVTAPAPPVPGEQPSASEARWTVLIAGVVRLLPLLLRLARILGRAGATLAQGIKLGLVLLALTGALLLLGAEVRAAAAQSPEERLARQTVAGFLQAAAAGRPQARKFLSPGWRRELEDQALALPHGTTFRVGRSRPHGPGSYLVEVHFFTGASRHSVLYTVVRWGDVCFLDGARERRRPRTS